MALLGVNEVSSRTDPCRLRRGREIPNTPDGVVTGTFSQQGSHPAPVLTERQAEIKADHRASDASSLACHNRCVPAFIVTLTLDVLRAPRGRTRAYRLAATRHEVAPC